MCYWSVIWSNNRLVLLADREYEKGLNYLAVCIVTYLIMSDGLTHCFLQLSPNCSGPLAVFRVYANLTYWPKNWMQSVLDFSIPNFGQTELCLSPLLCAIITTIHLSVAIAVSGHTERVNMKSGETWWTICSDWLLMPYREATSFHVHIVCANENRIIQPGEEITRRCQLITLVDRYKVYWYMFCKSWTIMLRNKHFTYGWFCCCFLSSSSSSSRRRRCLRRFHPIHHSWNIHIWIEQLFPKHAIFLRRCVYGSMCVFVCLCIVCMCVCLCGPKRAQTNIALIDVKIGTTNPR